MGLSPTALQRILNFCHMQQSVGSVAFWRWPRPFETSYARRRRRRRLRNVAFHTPVMTDVVFTWRMWGSTVYQRVFGHTSVTYRIGDGDSVQFSLYQTICFDTDLRCDYSTTIVLCAQADCFRVSRQNEAARRRTLRVRRTEQFIANG